MYWRITVRTFMLILAFVASSTAAVAQERDGVWIGLGGGLGFADITCDDCETDEAVSGVGYLRAGWTLNNGVLLGGEFNLWHNKFNLSSVSLPGHIPVRVSHYNLSGTVTYYLTDPAGFFVKGGAGLAFADTEFDYGSEVNFKPERGTGLGLIVGGGYDIRVGRALSVTPAVDFWYGQIGDLPFKSIVFLRGWKHHVIDFTIGVTFH